MSTTAKIVIPGAAGLIGQNLIPRLLEAGYAPGQLIAIDKHTHNLKILHDLHPEITCIEADLADPGEWESSFAGATACIQLQAQIGAPTIEPFIRNNIDSTKNVLAACEKHQVPYLIHYSSSVVKSVADDFYTNTKKEQEALVEACPIPHVILRPTLMFGWFDRKHLGWLSRFMHKTPVFPIPGNGKYMRQPLYAGDMAAITVSCLKAQQTGTYNISGLEKVDYIDIIRAIKEVTHSRSLILKIPYALFYALLTLYALFDRDPPFTTQQLAALVAHDEFEVINWPEIFSVKATPFKEALRETFTDPRFSHIVLDF